MNQERLSQLALNFIPGLGSYSIKQLVSYAGSAHHVFNLPKAKLLKIPGIGKVIADSILNHQAFARAEEELKRTEAESVKILLHTDQEYPKRLRQINDAPSLLYYKGTADLNTARIVSIVGTRNATPYGKEITEELVKELARHQALVVSGLAYGIDIQAHKSSLKYQVPTIGVMASGINIIYPAMHKETAFKMQEIGGLLTEHALDTKPDPHKFPARNRIIAGMSDATIIIEAAKKGGALITADIANSYNKDVFALPGKVTDPFSEGCNNLIKQNKAHLLTSITDLEYIMNWEEKDDVKEGSHITLEDFTQEEQLIISELNKESNAILIDNLSWRTNISINRLSSLLLNLEFQGIIKSLPGKRYQVTKSVY
ncbi:DNA-processing protein DprA [Fulvivirga maritima]|uniref:DNA-processing protein DprA n=1 Tax=Fulvivirga maritima TaxID=2904247 RepID=UPI001F371B8E|nr:DNA-processing protein DprA [Fulvivirga maritima]UII26043.1 DNA-processing protein DprA [Fulvivirga maritima]